MLTPLLLLALSSGADPAHLELAVSAGASYDTNPAGVSGIPDDVGSASLLAVASAGVARDVGERWSFYAGLRMDGLHEAQFDDISRVLAEAEGVALFSPWRPLALVVSLSAGGGFYGDPDRSGLVAGARAVLRVSPVDRLALRARFGWSRREARDSLYSSDGRSAGLGVEVRLSAASYLRAGGAFERADEVFYLPSDGMMAGASRALRTGRFGPSGGFSQPLDPVRALADSWTASAGIEIGIGRGVYLDGQLSRSWIDSVDSDLASYQSSSATVVLGVRR